MVRAISEIPACWVRAVRFEPWFLLFKQKPTDPWGFRTGGNIGNLANPLCGGHTLQDLKA